MANKARTTRTYYRRGTRLGKYRLEQFLGDGGFSQVWKAYDGVEQRFVALKIAKPVLPGSDEEAELLREIRIGAYLSHPNILQLRQADKVGDTYLMATELAIESLEDRLRRRLGTKRAVAYLEQLLHGMAYLHEQRVVHRDLKPSNILLFPGEQLRIGDMGLARVTKHTAFTGTGSGSVQYIAPEQAHGQPRFASDVFSLGLLAFEMLTGELPSWPFDWPFAGVESLRSKVPKELVNILRKACQPDYRRRFANAMDMLKAYERIKPQVTRTLYPQAARKRRQPRRGMWRSLRFRECERAYGKRLRLRFACPTCDGPISEHMHACPWCGEEGIAFGSISEFSHYCERCSRGLRDEWPFCPWCWGPAFPGADGQVRPDRRYTSSCKQCRNPMMDGMRYCPWCHAKESRPVHVAALPTRCGHCRSSVTTELWQYCPWCAGWLGG